MKRETKDAVSEGAIRSAAAVLPVVFDHPALGGAPETPWGKWPDGLLDVGAGDGHWMSAYRDLRPRASCIGVDVEARDPALGFPFVQPWDAEKGDRLPMRQGPGAGVARGDDPLTSDAWTAEYPWPLTICLEVAEHLTPDAGAWLVGEVCRVSAMVMWSAAVPDQGGDGHVNEQWPAYWAGLFAEQGWLLVDVLRQSLWDDERIDSWYRQNILIAVPAKGGSLPQPLALIHPRIYEMRIAQRDHWRQSYLDLAALHDGVLDR
jgi:hypothetical protein